MNLVVEVLVSVFLVVGAVFLFVGSYALIKLGDTMQRLHGPTKATTLGMGSVLIASMLYFWLLHGSPSIHELLITLFLFLTAPIGAHMIAKAHLYLEQHRRGTEAGPLRRQTVSRPD
jgi:multicomponent K+:H+ antiporter subunit G